MAIVQISQITNRLGLQADLPQLAGGELGWSTDARRLYIGNGTLQQGAPVIGNTEILTEFSDILNLAAFYTYKGTEATGYTVQTGPTANTPVIQSLQNWMDQWASVKDFGAKGDGVTDDTAAINRALNQLYCQTTQSPSIRRSLFFPAGVYLTTGTINIPPYATLYGEGPRNSIIRGTGLTYVAQTADSKQQTGVNIGNGGATPPTEITIADMAFESTTAIVNSAIFLIQNANSCHFTGVSFIGPLNSTTINNTSDTVTKTYGATFGSTPSYPTQDITFDNCLFKGVVFGAGTNQAVKSVLITASQFDTLYIGVALSYPITNNTITGFRVTNNLFDNIYSEGIWFGPGGIPNTGAQLNASGYNIFYNVGNNSLIGGTTPAVPVIQIFGNNNVSIGDMFARSIADAEAYSQPQVDTHDSASISTTNGSILNLGTKVVNSGSSLTLENVSTGNVVSINSSTAASFKLDYAIQRELFSGTGVGYRTGTFWVTGVNGAGSVSFMDDYTESADVGVTLFANETDGIITVQYTTTNLDTNGQLSYSTSYLTFPQL